MLGKVVKGGNFGGLTEYVLEKEGAEILDTNMAGRNHRELAKEFELVARKNERVRYPALHVSLSPHPEDKLSKEDLIDIGRKFLEKAGYENSQWAIAYHDDAIGKDGLPRPHLHLIINRVQPKNNFKSVSSWMDYKNTQKIVREIEREANLKQIKSSWESEKGANSTGQVRKLRANPQAEVSIKTQMQCILDSAIATSKSISEVIEKIEDFGVETRITVKDGAIEGISYKMGEVAIAARKLGSKYTIPRLKERKLKLGKLDEWYYHRREYENLAELQLPRGFSAKHTSQAGQIPMRQRSPLALREERSLKTLLSSSELRDRPEGDSASDRPKGSTRSVSRAIRRNRHVTDEALVSSELQSEVTAEILVNPELRVSRAIRRNRHVTDEALVNPELRVSRAIRRNRHVTDEALVSSELQSEVTAEILVNSELRVSRAIRRNRHVTDEMPINPQLEGEVTDEALDRQTDSKPNTNSDSENYNRELERQTKAKILKRKKELDLDL